MKKLILVSIFGFLFLGVFTNVADAYVQVSGYYRSNGTYVAPYVRSNPNGLKYDNYSYKPSQGLYNKTYGTRGSLWDTPTYITDPDYYLGKSIYDSGNNYIYSSSYYNSYYSPSYKTTPTCPSNSYYSGFSCKCNYGYINSGGSCVNADSLCYSQLGYSSSYNSIDNTCECDSGYVIGTSGQCISANSYCSSKIGIMSKYNSYSNKCECMYGYELVGSSCNRKKTSNTTSTYSSYYTPKSSYTSIKTVSCPANSYSSGGSCYCSSGYKISSDKSSCVTISTNTNDKICTSYYGLNSHWNGAKTSSGSLICDCESGYNWNTTRTACVIKKDKISGKDYYLINNTCVGVDIGDSYRECTNYVKNSGKDYYLTNNTCAGLTGDQYGQCLLYAYNH